MNIDIDKFFGKHAAILGNTGAGKSCTVTALVRSVLDRGMPNAHFIIFDTNNEYEHAFTQADGSPIYNRLVLRNNGDEPTGLWIPHWFMNSVDYQAFFRPGEGAQAPLLFTAISAARATSQMKASELHIFSSIEDTINQIDGFLKNPPSGKAEFYSRKNLREKIAPLLPCSKARWIYSVRPIFFQVGRSTQPDAPQCLQQYLGMGPSTRLLTTQSVDSSTAFVFS